MKKNETRASHIIEHSIYTLAEDMNLNPGTISRALRNRPEVKPETRALVQARANEIGFKLRKFTPRALNICAMVQTSKSKSPLFSSFTEAIMEGMWAYCLENDLELSMFSSSLSKLNAGFLVRQLSRRGANGVVVINASDSSQYFRQFHNENFPYCSVISAPTEAQPWIITVDHTLLTKRAVDYLISMGHSRIAIFCGPLEFSTFRSRFEGYKLALLEKGIEPNPMWILSPKNLQPLCSDNYEFGVAGAAEILRIQPRPTAIIAMNEECAVGILRVLHQEGVSVPQEISLLCFDDARLAQYLNPALTVVNVPNYEIGFEAASIVHRRILHAEFSGGGMMPIVRDADLIIRDSCGPAAKSGLSSTTPGG